MSHKEGNKGVCLFAFSLQTIWLCHLEDIAFIILQLNALSSGWYVCCFVSNETHNRICSIQSSQSRKILHWSKCFCRVWLHSGAGLDQVLWWQTFGESLLEDLSRNLWWKATCTGRGWYALSLYGKKRPLPVNLAPSSHTRLYRVVARTRVGWCPHQALSFYCLRE